MELIKIKFVFVLLISFAGLIDSHAQFEDFDILVREINEEYPDSILEYNILISKTDLKPDKDRVYAWFRYDVIHYNRGSYAGDLLHGRYLKYDKKGNLIGEGGFYYGLKHGTWKTWYPDGELAEFTLWKKGTRTKTYRYTKQGILREKTCYKRDNSIKRVVKVPSGKKSNSPAKGDRPPKEVKSKTKKTNPEEKQAKTDRSGKKIKKRSPGKEKIESKDADSDKNNSK